MGKSQKTKARFDVESLAWLGLLGFIGRLEHLYEPLGWFSLFHLFFFLFFAPPVRLIARAIRNRKSDRGSGTPHGVKFEDTGATAAKQEPEPRAMLTFTALAMLAVTVNPFGLVQSVAQLTGQMIAVMRRGGRLPSADTYSQKNRFTLPFEGRWAVVNGGIDRDTSHSWDIVTQRYAYDFVIMDTEQRTHKGEGTRPEDYYAFAQPMLAPAAGRVVRVRDGVRDFPSPRPRSGRIDWLTRDFRGNFVVIDHGHGEFSFLTHLQQGSICVRRDQEVARGQQIGLCGNSGHSTEPHLHFHVQDHPNFFLAVGLPVRFSDFRFADEPKGTLRSDAYLSRGQQVVADAHLRKDGTNDTA